MDQNLSIPAPAFGFGLAGLLPFFAGAIACWASPSFLTLPFELSGAFILCAYGAVILSFLGGIRWGVAMQHSSMIQDWQVVGWAMVPSLLGWLALLSSPRYGLVLLVLGFVLQFVIDYRSTRANVTPRWFARLRAILSFGAIVSVAAGWLGVLQS